MSKNAMAGAVTLCGVGLCVIGAALMMQSGNSAHSAGGMPLAAVAAVAQAQAGPTIVWYGLSQAANSWTEDNRQINSGSHENLGTVARAWSDGRVDALTFGVRRSGPVNASGWFNLNDPSAGFKAEADINAD